MSLPQDIYYIWAITTDDISFVSSIENEQLAYDSMYMSIGGMAALTLILFMVNYLETGINGFTLE